MLKPLPAEPYVYAEWKQCRVGVDYHVEVDKHFYSVPHTLLRETMWARITARTVEVFHPEQGFRACVGIMRLVKSYGAERVEAACGRALEIGARSYSSVNSILKTNRDRQRRASPTDEPAIIHDNIRGPRYFH